MNVIVESERRLLELQKLISDLRTAKAAQQIDKSKIHALEASYEELQQEMFGKLTPWQKVHMARHPSRPTSLDYIGNLDRFDELHGDRMFRDDPAIVAGFALLDGQPIMAMGEQRGRDTKENLMRNFGLVTPEGYRKVERLARTASRLNLPIVTFIDIKGADPGITSEEHAQSEAIAMCLYAFSEANVPIVAAVVGEGGSGGALALGIADHIIMLEHSVYSVASPDAAAAILWGDATKAEEAANRLKLTSADLQRFGIIDEIVPEPLGGAHREPSLVVDAVLGSIGSALRRLSVLSPGALREARYQKYRKIGAWESGARQAIGTRE